MAKKKQISIDYMIKSLETLKSECDDIKISDRDSMVILIECKSEIIMSLRKFQKLKENEGVNR